MFTVTLFIISKFGVGEATGKWMNTVAYTSNGKLYSNKDIQTTATHINMHELQTPNAE